MIFVTVGTSSWDFTRLIKEMDRIAGKIDEEVVMQIAGIEYLPKNARYFRFVSKEKIEELYKNARVVVSHAGVGCIISALKHNKPIIVVPRRKRYGELFDDHQIDIAKELEKEEKIKVVWNIKDLEKALYAVNHSINTKKDRKLVSMLNRYINDLKLSGD